MTNDDDNIANKNKKNDKKSSISKSSHNMGENTASNTCFLLSLRIKGHYSISRQNRGTVLNMSACFFLYIVNI